MCDVMNYIYVMFFYLTAGCSWLTRTSEDLKLSLHSQLLFSSTLDVRSVKRKPL